MKRIAAAAAVAVLALLPAGSAWAGDGGTLIVVPDKGTIDSPIDVVTEGVCEQGVTFVVAVRGNGIDPVTSGNAVGSTELRILDPAPYPGHHAVPLSRTLREYFTTNGVGAPVGDYDLVFACRNRLDMKDLQTFTAGIEIAKSGAYRAVGPAATPLDEFLTASSDSAAAGADGGSGNASADSAPGASDSATDSSADEALTPQESTPSGPSGARSDASDGEGGQRESAAAGDPRASPEVSQASATSPIGSGDSTWRTVLIGMGVLLFAGAAYMGWKARAR